MKKWFYIDGIHLYSKVKGHEKMHIVCFGRHEAEYLTNLLNDLFAYKLLVRKNKKVLEAVGGKPIKQQLKQLEEEW